MASSNLGNFAAGITLLHNDNNYLLKNSWAVFSSSSFPLILCRINVFLLSLTPYMFLVALMSLISLRLHSFTTIFHTWTQFVSV